MKKDYKRKCDDCGKFFLNSELHYGFARHKCKDCILIKKMQQNSVVIPVFIMKQYDLEDRSRVRLVPQKNGILIKKVK